MRITLTILCFLSSILSYGQSYKLFTADRELSSSLINNIFQDRNGIVWIATEDGLNRYDGAKFTVYKHNPDDKYSLAHNYVRTFFEDRQGRLFIGTHNGLQMYDPVYDRFTPRATTKDGQSFDSNIISILERANGEIWASGNILCSVTVEGDKLIAQPVNLPIPTRSVDYMIKDKNQNIWMTKGEEGIYLLKPNNEMVHYLGYEKDMTVVDICEDIYGNIYAGTMGKGLLKFDKKNNKFVAIPYQGKENLPVKALYPSNQDELYIGTDGNGLKVLNIKTQKITDYSFETNFFDSNTAKVHSIMKDKSGNLWLAIYQKGVAMIPPQSNSFKYLGHKSINNNNIIGSCCITSLFRSGEGTLWVGTDNDGIYGITQDNKPKVHFSPIIGNHSVPPTVMKIYEDSEKNLWVGSFLNGMGKLDPRTGHCTYQQDLLDKDGKHIQRVYDFAEDKEKRLWIATMGAGLFYYDLKSKRTVYDSIANLEINKWICCLLITKDDKLYAGTYDGIFSLDLNNNNRQFNRFLDKHIVISLYEDSKGIIWIGTSEGLNMWDPKTKEQKRYTIQDGLPNNVINGIQEDDLGNLWLSTNSGISQFFPNSQKFINYFVGDGLQGNEFSKNASFQDKNGTIWLGGMNGITYFNPVEIVNPTKKWNVRITNFYLHNEPVRKGMNPGKKDIIDKAVFDAEEFHLSHKDNAFSIEFSTIELDSPERIVYLYAMNNDKWTSLPQGVNRVSFSNLSPGTYHFRIKAQDNQIDSDVKEIIIYIAPAWWASIWAKFVYLLLTIGIIYLIIHQIRHHYRTKQEILQHVHAEQINEAKLQFFINISHEIRTPMSLIISPLQKLMSSDSDHARQKIYQTIYRNSERILRLINQMMDIRKIDKGQMTFIFRPTNIIECIDDVCDTFAQQVAQRHIELQFHHKGIDELNLWVDTANFDKIILNVLSNAFKFTPDNGKIDIFLHTGKSTSVTGPLAHYVEIIIADTGIGISTSELEHIFDRFYQVRNSQSILNIGTGVGLHLTRSLVELHHGSIHAESNTEEAGSRFVIRLPLGNSHLRPEEMEDTDENKPKPIYIQKAPEPLIIPSDTDKNKTYSKNKYRVLIAEDDGEIRSYISQELSSQYHILEYSNGKEALEAIFKKAPDLIISDVMMPEMDGMTFCKKIKQNINLNHIPIILLTAKAQEEDNLEGLESGADVYMTKPFNIEILRKTVDNLISGRERLRNTFSGSQIQEDKLEKIELQSPDEKLMERIMKVINANLSNPNLTVEMITSEIGISRVHLHRKLKELTNQSTRNFIRNTRLNQAAKLLTESKHNITEIAELTGFANSNNFSTAFKDLFGVPPTTYMAEHMKKSSDTEEEK